MGSEKDELEIVLHGEEADLRKRWVSGEVLRVCKRIDGYTVKEVVQRLGETAEVERVTVADGDSGEIETLPDGTISIPLLEEELVIEKRVVVRERVLVRRRIVEEETPVRLELQRERLEMTREPPADSAAMDEPPPRSVNP
jgi:uncharacterized protein (TIGR02271 family)